MSSSDHGKLLVLFAANRAARSRAGNTARIVTPAMCAPTDIDSRSGYAVTEREYRMMKQPFALRMTLRKGRIVGGTGMDQTMLRGRKVVRSIDGLVQGGKQCCRR